MSVSRVTRVFDIMLGRGAPGVLARAINSSALGLSLSFVVCEVVEETRYFHEYSVS